jgi:hypothetical protein
VLPYIHIVSSPHPSSKEARRGFSLNKSGGLASHYYF